jgi:hypothetical protein
MKKTLVAAFLISAGAGGLAFAQGVAYAPNWIAFPYDDTVGFINKVGTLNVSLQNTFQAFGKGAGGNTAPWGVQTTPNRGGILGNQPWDNWSYEAIELCVADPVQYRSAAKSVNNAYIIKSINAAFSQVGGLFKRNADPNNNPNPFFGGAFGTTTAKIVVINYDNQLKAPPYPPTEDNFYPRIAPSGTVWNAPWNLVGIPDPVTDGTILPLAWPNQNYISWGKPDPAGSLAGGPKWIGAKVYIIDPNNPNPNLQCFDVTPFFALEEAYCFYCWDTQDRVTDGKIIASAHTSEPPCSGIGSFCGRDGNGVTKFYWTVKFNSIGSAWTLNPNNLLDWYYPGLLQISTDWALVYGTQLDDNNFASSSTSLAFTVNGIATYNWKYATMKSDGARAPIGNFTMTASGHGYSPMCGVFNGPVSINEVDRASTTFNNKVTKASVLCF